MVIGVDCQCGDYAPKAILKAVGKFSGDNPDISLVLIGDSAVEKIVPLWLLRRQVELEIKEGNSVNAIARGINLLQNQKIDAFVTAGDTKAIVHKVIRERLVLPGLERPVYPLPLPKCNGKDDGVVWLVDGGVNVDCSGKDIFNFALLSNCFLESQGKSSPKIGLLNIGTEDDKGNKAVREAKALLEASGLNYIGFIEPNQLPDTIADAVVCDGFVGNSILKFGSSYVKHILKSPLMKLAFLITQPHLARRFAYEQHGGTPLLGVSKIIVKAHGRANAQAFRNAIKRAREACQNGEIEKIVSVLSLPRAS